MLKKLLNIAFVTATLLLPSFTFADETVTNDIVYSSNVLGLLPVTSSAARTVIGVPWCAMSETNNLPISVSNIVKTANLTENDTIHYVTSYGTFESWRLAKNASSNVLYWDKVKEAGEEFFSESEDPNLYSLNRGGALILIRQNPTTTAGDAKSFYLFGQVATNDVVSSTLAQGTTNSPAYSIIASPKTVPWDVNEDIKWTNVSTNDMVSVPGNNGARTQLYWDKDMSKWCSISNLYKQVKIRGVSRNVCTGMVRVVYSEKIPAAMGIWYISHGGNAKVDF